VNTNEFLDREYNPRVQIADFADYLTRWKNDAQGTRDSLPGRLHVAYGAAAAETLDYFPATSPPLAHARQVGFFLGGARIRGGGHFGGGAELRSRARYAGT
jgi:hypothetical protein